MGKPPHRSPQAGAPRPAALLLPRFGMPLSQLPAQTLARARAWWQARIPRSDALTLTQRNVYILPSRAGMLLVLTLVVLLIASINYQLSLGYILTFLLAGSAAAGMIVGHNTLRGLHLHLAPPEPVFAGAPAVLRITLINARPAPRYAVGVVLQGARERTWADVPDGGEALLELSMETQRRGLHAIPKLVVETRFPLGTFHVWAPWHPATRVLVYPAPEPVPPPLPFSPQPGAGDALQASAAAGDFDGVRAYRAGDPLKLVVWKKFAQSGALVSRASTQAQHRVLWLDWARAGGLDVEARLARLTAWVLAADWRGLTYGLRLPDREIAPANGAVQRQRCLRALALC